MLTTGAAIDPDHLPAYIYIAIPVERGTTGWSGSLETTGIPTDDRQCGGRTLGRWRRRQRINYRHGVLCACERLQAELGRRDPTAVHEAPGQLPERPSDRCVPAVCLSA